MAGSAIILIIVEIWLKWKVLFSNSFILDDAFMFERALYDRPFNDLSKFLSSFQNTNFDGYLVTAVYRSLVVMAGDIVTLRLIFLVLFAVATALFSLLIYRVTKDRIFSILAGTFSLLTPFSLFFVLFTSGSYYLTFFIIFAAGLICGTYIDPHRPFSQTGPLIVAMTSLFALSAALLGTGSLLCLSALIWIFYHTRSFTKPNLRRLFYLCGVILVAQTVWTILTLRSPYEDIPGRVNYDFFSMFINGLRIINRSVSSYLFPNISTGTLTRQPSLWIAGTFIIFILGLHFWLIKKFMRERIRLLSLPIEYSLSLFLGVSAVLAIGPYSLLTHTHPWHYFSPLIFLGSMTFLLIYLALGKRIACFTIFLAAVFTIESHSNKTPDFVEASKQQAQFANFIRAESELWSSSDRIYLILTQAPALQGFNVPFRSTGFNRYISENPNAPYLSICYKTIPEGELNTTEPGAVFLYEMNKSGDYKRIN
ncbi:hypothetical protein [Litorimonas sp.]|uniref:hypothetical protein n=1 Tax=Litorimonas sp. TaxID=1892381 RepID=UPI003A892D32